MIDQCVCNKCGYIWEPRKKDPKQCPRCKQYGWGNKKEIDTIKRRITVLECALSKLIN